MALDGSGTADGTSLLQPVSFEIGATTNGGGHQYSSRAPLTMSASTTARECDRSAILYADTGSRITKINTSPVSVLTNGLVGY